MQKHGKTFLNGPGASLRGQDQGVVLGTGRIHPTIQAAGSWGYRIFTVFSVRGEQFDSIDVPNNPSLSKEKLKRTRDRIATGMKKLLDKDGLWKKSISTFCVEKNDPLWMDINGHDVLSAITYVNETAKEEFSNAAGYALNRDFEFALSEAYDYSQLKKTRLHKKLLQKGLLAVI